MSATLAADPFTGRCLVSFFPCGCWGAVAMQYTDLNERAKSASRFLREAGQDGASRVEEMTHEAWSGLRNGVRGDLTHGCDHEPRWGGAASTHDDCPRCGRSVRLRKDGGLYSHSGFLGLKCSQQPYGGAS